MNSWHLYEKSGVDDHIIRARHAVGFGEIVLVEELAIVSRLWSRVYGLKLEVMKLFMIDNKLVNYVVVRDYFDVCCLCG